MEANLDRSRSGGLERRVACLVAAVALAFWSVVATAARESSQPLDVVVVLDVSGSMSRNDPHRLVPKAAADFVRSLGDADGIGLVAFGSEARALAPLASLTTSGQRDVILEALQRLRYADKLTDMAAGIERGLYELRVRGREDSAKALVFLSDGIVETGSKARDRERETWLRQDLVNEARARGVRIFSIALSEQADFLLIREIAATTGGEYYRVLNDEDATRTFAALGTRLAATPAPSTPSAASTVPADSSSPPETAFASRTTGLLGFGALATVVALLLSGSILLIVSRRRRARTHVTGDGHGEVRREQPMPGDAPLPHAVLVEVPGGKRYVLEKQSTSIGRDSANEVVVLAGTVSSRHARIDRRAGRYTLTDLRSANGTFLNGNRLASEATLADGDTIHFDQYRFRFETEARVGTGTIVRPPGEELDAVQVPDGTKRRTLSAQGAGNGKHERQ